MLVPTVGSVKNASQYDLRRKSETDWVQNMEILTPGNLASHHSRKIQSFHFKSSRNYLQCVQIWSHPFWQEILWKWTVSPHYVETATKFLRNASSLRGNAHANRARMSHHKGVHFHYWQWSAVGVAIRVPLSLVRIQVVWKANFLSS